MLKISVVESRCERRLILEGELTSDLIQKIFLPAFANGYLYVANEGKLLAIVASDSAAPILRKMREHPLGRDAQVIGEVVSDHPGMVLMKTGIGGTRVVDVLFGEQLPRIC